MQLILAIVGSSSLTSLIIFLIQRRDKRKQKNDVLLEKLNNLEQKTIRNEKDNVRLQLLLLMSDYNEDKAEIMRCAEHYFKDLEGNWYVTPLFKKWLVSNDIPLPEWFD